jgi:hypothetical protein
MLPYSRELKHLNKIPKIICARVITNTNNVIFYLDVGLYLYIFDMIYFIANKIIPSKARSPGTCNWIAHKRFVCSCWATKYQSKARVAKLILSVVGAGITLCSYLLSRPNPYNPLSHLNPRGIASPVKRERSPTEVYSAILNPDNLTQNTFLWCNY